LAKDTAAEKCTVASATAKCLRAFGLFLAGEFDSLVQRLAWQKTVFEKECPAPSVVLLDARLPQGAERFFIRLHELET
jgi:hypothetical protein